MKSQFQTVHTANNPQAIDMPAKFKALVLSGKRFKVAHGGRGGAKTYSFATIFLLKSREKKIRVLCAREIMRSIKESVHATLCKRIQDLGLSSEFIILRDSIVHTKTQAEFLFVGLYRNIQNLKGLEDIDYVWISEGQSASEESLQVLFPSIRKNGSEIWIEFNDEYEDQAVYRRFVANPDPDAEVIFVNWNDNPFISQTLLAQKDSDYARLPTMAPHIWEGKLKGFGGLIWTPPFNPQVHVRDFPWHMIQDKVNVIHALDPHQHFYPAAVWIALIKMTNGVMYRWVFAEWPTFGTFSDYYSAVRTKVPFTGTLMDMSTTFKDIESKIPVPVRARYIDSRFAKGIGGAGWSAWTNKTEGIVESWRKPENGALTYICPREGIMDAQRNVIKSYMTYDTTQPINELNEPTTFVSPACKNLIQSLQNHRLEQDSEREAETYKDFSDCLRIGFAGLQSWNWVNDNPSTYYDEFPRRDLSHSANSWQRI
jgi:hypothetical protein